MMIKNLLLIFSICFLFGCAQSCRAQEDDGIVEMSPDVHAELVFFFKKGTDWKKVLEFERTVIGIPAPDGTGYSSLPGMMSVVKINIDDFEGEAINFQSSATKEEKAFVKKRVSDSPLVYKIYENVVPNEITDLYLENEHSILPSFVNECLDKNAWLLTRIDIPARPKYNPYFARGDLDGDGFPDYVVVVEGKDDKRDGLLVCFRVVDRKAVLLGLDQKNKPPFWRLTDWDVETVPEIAKMTDLKGVSIGVRPKGESIVMKWEDALGIIYWDGKQFQWKQVILNEGS
jgi:hypothetical protein